MKKILFLSLITFTSLSSFAGFIDNSLSNINTIDDIITIDKIATLPDDSFVRLKGHILKSLTDEKYLFADTTGTITIEIDDDDFKYLTITPQDLIIIKGEVDKELLSTKIDVQTIEKVY